MNSSKVIDLDPLKAREYFLKNSSYVNFDLPYYINFQELLDVISAYLLGKSLSQICNKVKGKPNFPCFHEQVNHIILSNKEGFYSWRPLHIIHPVIYVYIVRLITEKANWKLIQGRFKDFSMSGVKCISIPRESDDQQSDKASLIEVWWKEIEQYSIKLSLEFNYIFKTDITDCYGSLYTHSIDWALDRNGKESSKKRAKNRDTNKSLGGLLDRAIRNMTYNQTNGIPQGSILMDFIAEIVLGYADENLSKKIKDAQIPKKNYCIIRYRDDYRIFVNDPNIGHLILKLLNEVLHDLGMKLNSVKTHESGDVILSSIKNEKLERILLAPNLQTLQKEALRIYQTSRKYLNSGIILTELSKLYERVSQKELMENDNWEKAKEDLVSVISILVMTAYYSPRVINWVSAIISKLLEHVKKKNEKILITKKIYNRFRNIPHTGFIDIWLQRISEPLGVSFEYEDKLAKISLRKISNHELWNSAWLHKELKTVINFATISKLTEDLESKSIPLTIEKNEVEVFKTDYF